MIVNKILVIDEIIFSRGGRRRFLSSSSFHPIFFLFFVLFLFIVAIKLPPLRENCIIFTARRTVLLCYCLSVRLSVCPSVTLVNVVKSTEYVIKLLYHLQVTKSFKFSQIKHHGKIPTESPSTVAMKKVGVRKILVIFDQ